MSDYELHTGDALGVLRTLPSESVHCVVTSPPYWGHRDYGVDGQIGLEPTPSEYVETLVEVFREVRRVLRPDGTLWLNIGDTYASMNGACRNPGGGPQSLGKHLQAAGATPVVSPNRLLRPGTDGLKRKDLVGIPWRLAFALQADGWWLRQEIIWFKPNAMVQSVRDRCTTAHEHVFLLSKADRYFYDSYAIQEPAVVGDHPRTVDCRYQAPGQREHKGLRRYGLDRAPGPQWRNKRSVWTIPTYPLAEEHFATFPPALPRTCILAGTSGMGCCPDCGAPWQRIAERQATQPERSGGWKASGKSHRRDIDRKGGFYPSPPGFRWENACGHCPHLYPAPCAVLDPFNGAGTTGMEALRLGRSYVGIELNPRHVEMTERRFRNLQTEIPV